MIAREVKRKRLVNKYAAKRKSLLNEFNAAKDPMERLEIHRKIQGLPSCNGWDFWHVKDKSKSILLDEIRSNYRKDKLN